MFIKRSGWMVVLLSLSITSVAQAGQYPGLKSVMQGLGEAWHALGQALLVGDLATVEREALYIADHPRPPMEERTRIMARLGDDAPAFRGTDMQVHETAGKLAKAAANGDLNAVTQHYGEVMQACVACHTGFRDRLLKQ